MAMQPFKMLVGDMVNERQKGLAYSIQSFLCNAGSVVGYVAPFVLAWFLSNTAPAGEVIAEVVGIGSDSGENSAHLRALQGISYLYAEEIGRGELGSSFFGRLMSDSRFDGVPLILETPDPSVWKMEID